METGFGSDYVAMALQKSRHEELMAQAENERTARSLRQELVRPLRRRVRRMRNTLRR